MIHPPILQEIPQTSLQTHSGIVRQPFGGPAAERFFMRSIRDYGLMTPLVVHEIGDGRYEIVDGYWRYHAARAAGINTLPCMVFENLTPAEYARVRFDLNDVGRRRTKRDISASLKQMKDTQNPHYRACRELRDAIFLSA
jgi:hypothetical protein